MNNELKLKLEAAINRYAVLLYYGDIKDGYGQEMARMINFYCKQYDEEFKGSENILAKAIENTPIAHLLINQITQILKIQ